MAGVRKVRRKFTPEYRVEAARLVVETGRPIAHVAQELGLVEQTLGKWVNNYRQTLESESTESYPPTSAWSLKLTTICGHILLQLALVGLGLRYSDFLWMGNKMYNGVFQRVTGVVAAAVVLMTMATFTAPAQAKLPEVTRIAGQDRYDTTVKIRHQILGDAKTVYVASGQSPVDALSAAPVAAQNGAAIILSEAQSLPAVTASSLRENRVEHSFVIGGDRTLSPQVKNQVDTFSRYPSQRVAGVNRYDTAARLSTGGFSKADTVYLASGVAPHDALSASVLAAHKGAPLLLTEVDSVPSVTVDALKTLSAKRVVIVGGEAVVRESVEKSLAELGIQPTRLGGSNRYETALAVMRYGWGQDYAGSVIWVSGQGLADALAAIPASAKLGIPLRLTALRCNPVEPKAGSDLVVGGRGAIAESAWAILCPAPNSPLVPDGPYATENPSLLQISAGVGYRVSGAFQFRNPQAALKQIRQDQRQALVDLAKKHGFSELGVENWRQYQGAVGDTNPDLARFFDAYENTFTNRELVKMVQQYEANPSESGLAAIYMRLPATWQNLDFHRDYLSLTAAGAKD